MQTITFGKIILTSLGKISKSQLVSPGTVFDVIISLILGGFIWFFITIMFEEPVQKRIREKSLAQVQLRG
jgi:hypothetical protein